ncbi:MAG: PH domain-containing protein [Pseudomonadota bacterium]
MFIVTRTTEFAVTNKKVIAKQGFISRKTVELNLSKVESLSVDQGIFGRIFNFGKVVVRGTGGVQAPFSYIADPMGLRKAVNEEYDKSHYSA